MSDNITSAVASWLGYVAQEYRLVERLLKANKANTLGFELLDDVEEHSEEHTVLEQDKISVTRRNIVSNKSKDLWKTISNWVDLITSGKIDVSKVTFLLYTNKEHSGEVLELLCNANCLDDAKASYESITALVDSPSDNIKKYVDNFLSLDKRKYTLIENFQYVYGTGSASNDLKSTYLGVNTSVTDKAEDILHEILGWTRDVLTELAEKRQATLIEAKAFGNRLGQIESKYRQQSLLEFICRRSGDDTDVVSELSQQPTYIKQLNVIDIEEKYIEEAAIAKLEVKDAVSKWTVDGDVQASSYQKYNDALQRKWQQQKTITLIRDKALNEQEKGQLLYVQCLQESENVFLENKKVDDFFSRGTYQNLANTEDVGWHPEYKKKLMEDENDT
jgi:hypothetical protein